MIMAKQGEETREKKKVLVVDDELDFLSIMNFFLTLEGYLVETVSDGAEAIKSVKKDRPDLILLDVIMPIMDGYSALKELRQNNKTRDIPVIMLSIIDQTVEQKETLNITDYLVKPFSSDILIQKIRQTLAA
jgi:CheY-like chemotaxis protein